MKTPQELKYTKTDEWVKVEGKTATIGISDYAQDQLSDVVYVEIVVSENDDVAHGEVCTTIKSVKAAADVNTPVSGKVASTNDALADTPESVNSDPYGEAWMLKIDMSDPDELKDLMDADAYAKYCEKRGD